MNPIWDKQTLQSIIQTLLPEKKTQQKLLNHLNQPNYSDQTIQHTIHALLKETLPLHNLHSSLHQLDDPNIPLKHTLTHIIATLHDKLYKQLTTLLHHPTFQHFESTWKSLHFLIKQTHFEQNIQIDILNTTKNQIAQDFQDCSQLTQSTLYDQIYTKEYGQFGGNPYTLILGDFSFTPHQEDIMILQNLSRICAMSHAIFISDVDPSMFLLQHHTQFHLSTPIDEMIQSMQQFKHFKTLQTSQESSHIGLCMPRFLLRSPYHHDNPITPFSYHEPIQNDPSDLLWARASFLFTLTAIKSFENYRLCSHLIHQPQPIKPTPSNMPNPAQINHPALEILYSKQEEHTLTQAGFIVLNESNLNQTASFSQAHSIAKIPLSSKKSPHHQTIDHQLNQHLSYKLIINRIAHYLKIIQRENIGTLKNQHQLEQELNTWIAQYTSNQTNPSTTVQTRRPLKHATIKITTNQQEHHHHQMHLQITPHLKYMGQHFTLSLISNLHKENQS